jgi:phosphatidate cytidylyltransferase
MKAELKKRIITSIFLLLLLVAMFLYTFVLIISLIIVSVIAWIEFYALISKIFKKNNSKHKTLRFFYKAISLLFLLILVFFIIDAKINSPELELIIIYSIYISIMTDIGGLIFGKIFGGKKLTRISPKKTISGSIGSFIFSLLLIPIFIKYFDVFTILDLVLITLFISLISQAGDLYISYLKRLAGVKDTSDLLPGHGGVLDRIDGIIFSIPIGIFLFNFF